MGSRSFLARATRQCVAAAALAALLPAGSALAAEPLSPQRVVKDPHYGDTLFHFFQDHYFTSITTLMTSQHFDRVPAHADEAEVLRGGLLLSYGLHREAGQIFTQLIEKGASPKVRDRAWYYLAKIRYQRGFLAEAEQAIDRVENHLPPELEDDRGLLKANLLMARGDHAGAATVLNGMARRPGAGQYARFNLGVALVRSGDTAGGSALLDEIGRAPQPNEEFRTLRDKANVALGFAALQDERAEAARGYLERVRLESLHANKALLGFGWAAAALKQPGKALVPWTELAQRDDSDSAVLEGRIALPYAYAELGALGQALERYNEAIAAYDREGAHLNESIAAIRAGKLVEGLIDRNPGDEMGWFWTLRELPELPHAGHLAQVLAEHEFQEAFKNYRDLRFLSNNLQHWADNLGVFGDMLANRRQAFAQRLTQVQASAKANESGLDAVQRRRDTLAGDVERAESQADGVAFADARQRELQVRIDGVRAALKEQGSDPQFATAPDRVRLAAGALSWQLAQDYPARVWEAKKALQTIDSELAEARRRDTALAQAQRDEPARFGKFDGRIAELDRRIQVLIPRVAALSREQQQVVQDIAVAALTRQQERLTAYLTQARFAVAQLHDRATLAKEADRAPAQ